MKSLAVRLISEFSVDGIEPAALGSKKGQQAADQQAADQHAGGTQQ
jgi:hypothetical protein